MIQVVHEDMKFQGKWVKINFIVKIWKLRRGRLLEGHVLAKGMEDTLASHTDTHHVKRHVTCCDTSDN